METKIIDGEVYLFSGYRFERSNAEDLRKTLERNGRIVEMIETTRSGYSVRGKFENKTAYEMWTR
jgi:hypothetical protein